MKRRIKTFFIITLFSCISFLLSAGGLETESQLTKILKGDITIDSDSINWHEGNVAKILEEKAKKEVQKRKQDYSTTEMWQLKALNNDLHFSDDDFLSLPIEIQKTVYQTANHLNRIDFVRKIKQYNSELEPKWTEEDIIKPGIFSQFMDIVSIHDTLAHYIRDLFQNGLLTTEEKFIDKEKWIKQQVHSNLEYNYNDDIIGRLFGRDYIEAICKKNNFKFIKVPTKVLVITDRPVTPSTFWLYPAQTSNSYIRMNLYNRDTKNLFVYAEKIIPDSTKKIDSKEKIDELFALLQESGYGDLGAENIILTQEGYIYFIDTEYISFDRWQPPFSTIKELVSEDLQEYYDQKREKLKKYEQYPHVLSYQDAAYFLNESLGSLQRKLKKTKEELTKQAKETIQNCMLVGSKYGRTIAINLNEVLGENWQQIVLDPNRVLEREEIIKRIKSKEIFLQKNIQKQRFKSIIKTGLIGISIASLLYFLYQRYRKR